jgi:hypothetical protein
VFNFAQKVKDAAVLICQHVVVGLGQIKKPLGVHGRTFGSVVVALRGPVPADGGVRELPGFRDAIIKASLAPTILSKPDRPFVNADVAKAPRAAVLN